MKKWQTEYTLAQRSLSWAARRLKGYGTPFTLELSVSKCRTGSPVTEKERPYFYGKQGGTAEVLCLRPDIFVYRDVGIFLLRKTSLLYNYVKNTKGYKSLL